MQKGDAEMAIQIIHADAATQSVRADMIVTDPPFEMDGEKLSNVLSKYYADHLILICSMRQLLDYSKHQTAYKFGFDMVLDIVAPKQSKSQQQPNYTHAHAVYFYRKKSAFNRKLGRRFDVFTDGYFPTIVRAPRERNDEHGHAKSVAALQSILSFFDVKSVVDPFAGSGTTGLACAELGLDCTMIEQSAAHVKSMQKTFRFLGLIA